MLFSSLLRKIISRTIDKGVTFVRNNLPTDFSSNADVIAQNDPQMTTDFALVAQVDTSTPEPSHPGDKRRFESPNISLDTFLNRPVKLGVFDWTPTGITFPDFRIVDAWMTAQADKLKGFRYFSGDIMVKVVVQGNPFSYGKALIAFDPYAGTDSYGKDSQTTLAMPRPNFAGQFFTLPHIEIDPSLSKTYEIRLPFVSTIGYRDRSFLSATFGHYLSDWWFTSIVVNPLLTANAGIPPNISINVFMWLENIQMAVPIYKHEMKKVPHEATKEGAVSALLGKVSKVASLASSVPALTPYMAPFSAAASMAGNLASSFGFSSPTILEIEAPYTQRRVGDTSTYDHRDPSVKLSNSLAQEVAIDALAAGVGDDDDMLISSVISRTGFLGTVPWPVGTYTTLLTGFTGISPTLCPPLGPNGEIYMTPLAFVATAFDLWTGPLILTVELIATTYHRGSVAVTVNPSMTAFVGDGSDSCQTVIIDLAGTRKVDIEIPYTFPSQWANVLDKGHKIQNTANETEVSANITITPLSFLSANGSTTPVYVNLYIRADERFALARPRLPRHLQSLTPFPQVNLVSYEAEVTTTSSLYGTIDPHIFKTNIGEKIDSLRQVVKKYATYSMYNLTVPGTAYDYGINAIVIPSFPTYPQYSLANMNQLTEVRVESINWTYMTWFSQAFLARRGGVRWKCGLIDHLNGDFAKGYAAFGTDRILQNPYYNGYLAGTGVLDFSDDAVFANHTYTNLAAQPFIEIEVPTVEQTNFSISRRNVSPDYNTSHDDRTPHVVLGYMGPNVTDTHYYPLEVAAADDFSLNQFLYVPAFYARQNSAI